MPCYHPLKAIKIGTNLETGKDKYAISRYNSGDDLSNAILLPCGQCIGCRIDYSRQWADRCMLELKDHESSYFLTLTYDEQHLDSIKSGYTDCETGEYHNNLTLNKRDAQLWHKNLRKALDEKGYPKIRFFMCGEYGSNTFRPHLHEICFGLRLDDLKFYKYNKQGQPLYTSEFLSKIWKKGFVIVGEVTWETCAYVARYVTKKLKGQSGEFYQIHNIVPPFTLMSRKPGIARKYYEEHPDFFDCSYISIATDDGGRKIYPSRYYKSLLEVDDPERFADLKLNNMVAAEFNNDARLSQTDLDYKEYLKVCEDTFSSKIKSLARKEV